MEVSGTNIGASTYALKKAMEMPNILMSLIQNAAGSGDQSLATKTPVPQAVDVSAATGKGRIIDLVA